MEGQSSFSTVKTGAWLSIALMVIGGIAALVSGLMDGVPVAYVVLGGIVAIIMIGMGSIATLFIQWYDEARDARRARREQERFTANQAENLQLIAATSKAQAVQGLALTRQAQAARLLPASAPADMIEFDPSLFIEGDVE